jgi:hypothetical protein
MEQSKISSKLKVKKEKISLSDIKIAKAIREKRETLNYGNVVVPRW